MASSMQPKRERSCLRQEVLRRLLRASKPWPAFPMQGRYSLHRRLNRRPMLRLHCHHQPLQNRFRRYRRSRHQCSNQDRLCHGFGDQSEHFPWAMKFGKDFRNHLDETLPDWRDKFLCYKPLKKLIKNLPPDGDDGADGRPWIGLEEWFVRILDEELEKFNDFYVDKEEEFVIRLQELKERIERVRARQSNAFKSESEFSEEMLEIRKAFVAIHGEMVLLKNYSSLNFAGLVKILKKYDKRTGGLLSLPFTRRALHQPFFITDPLTRLVHECEANLELLFPIEAEVTSEAADSSENKNRRRIRSKSDSDKNTDAETSSSSLREDADHIYRSTLAAMKAIQGLRRASSTYNPLSLGQFFRAAGDDCSAAVTSEDSSSNCTSTLPSKEDDEDSVHSGDH